MSTMTSLIMDATRFSNVRLLRATYIFTLNLRITSILLCLALASGTKHSFATTQDSRLVIAPIGAPFGFLTGGEYNLTVFDFKLTGHYKTRKKGSDLANENDILDGVESGFLLKRFKSERDFSRYHRTLTETCSFESFRIVEEDDLGILADDDGKYLEVGDSPDAAGEGVFLSLSSMKRWGQATPSISHTFRTGEEGLYILIYQVCHAGNIANHTEIWSTFELDLTFHNFDLLGNISYLTAGEMPLGRVFLYFSVSYAFCLMIWVANISNIQQGKQATIGKHTGLRPVIYPIHHVMTLLLFIKTLSVFFESVRYHYIRVSGQAEIWSILYYAISFVKGALLFTAILLIGTGWSFLKPFLSSRDKKIIACVLLLQIIDNLAVVVLNQEVEGERLYDDWSAVVHLVDIICCCAILIPIVWQVNALEQNAESAGSDARRTLLKLKLFRSFYLLVVAYIYLTRIFVFLLSTYLDYRHTWIREFVTELGTLAFYTATGYLFRPMEANPYLEVKFEQPEEEVELVGI